MEYTLEQIAARVRYAFYRMFDGEPGPDGVAGYYWVESVFPASIIVARYGDNPAYYRVDYVFVAGLGLDVDVQFAAVDSWEETVFEWVPVERDAAERMKRELRVRFEPGAWEEAIFDDSIIRRWANPEPGRTENPVDVIQRGAVRTEVRALEGADDDENRSTFWIMTDRVARDGAIVDADGLDVSHYRENPVVLWQHGGDPQRGANPIARAVDLQRRDQTVDGETVRGWTATIEWADDDFARDIRDKVKRGFISMTSLGWIGRAEIVTRDGKRIPYYRESEMIEFSVVGIGSDRHALAVERAFGTPTQTPDVEQRESASDREGDDANESTTADAGEDTPAQGAGVRPLSLREIRERADERRRKVREAALRKLGRA